MSAVVARAGFGDTTSFELAQRGAKALASSSLLPTRFQGSIPDCMIVLEMAQRLGASPMMVAQNLYIVHGTPAWSAKFIISCVNASQRFEPLRYEWKGQEGADDYGCRAWTTAKGSDEKLHGPWITWALVKAEGWHSKSGSKWKTIPELMFRYRAASWWAATTAPELTMGLRTVEEERDIIDITPSSGAAALINAQLAPPQAVDEPETDPETGEIPVGEPESMTYAHVADAETGEIVPQDEPLTLSFAQVEDMINSATDTNALDLAVDSIDAAPEKFHGELRNLAKKKAAEIEAGIK